MQSGRRPKGKNIISENLGTGAECFYQVAPESLPAADVVIGSFSRFNYLSAASLKRYEELSAIRENIFQTLFLYIRPKAFLFEINVRMKKGNTFYHMMDRFEREGYVGHYCEIDIGQATGSPVRQRRGYIAALKNFRTSVRARVPWKPLSSMTFHIDTNYLRTEKHSMPLIKKDSLLSAITDLISPSFRRKWRYAIAQMNALSRRDHTNGRKGRGKKVSGQGCLPGGTAGG